MPLPSRTRNAWFCRQSAMKINLFNKDVVFENYAAGQTVFREGDDGEKMYAVIGGTVDIIIKGKMVERIDSGGVFGEMALIESRPRVATALVSADAKLVPVDRRR